MMMKPKFADAASWELADRLMQPALIRTIDNIRKQLETSTWRGEYRDYPIWADDVSGAIREQVERLQQELKTATPEQVDAIAATLATLPQPMPGYELCLTKDDREQQIVDIWDVCYRICFGNADRIEAGELVEIDRTLLEDGTEDVDWSRLDEKTKGVIGAIFDRLD
jgi:hypothetical protein